MATEGEEGETLKWKGKNLVTSEARGSLGLGIISVLGNKLCDLDLDVLDLRRFWLLKRESSYDSETQEVFCLRTVLGVINILMVAKLLHMKGLPRKSVQAESNKGPNRECHTS